MQAERRPADEALLAALRLNDDHVRGLTRLDQQFIYVPLGALAAAVYAAPSLWAGIPRPVLGAALAIALLVVSWLVLSGLRRNNGRHEELLRYREQLMQALELPAEPPRSEPLWHGRRLYFRLFMAGLVLGGVTLLFR